MNSSPCSESGSTVEPMLHAPRDGRAVNERADNRGVVLSPDGDVSNGAVKILLVDDEVRNLDVLETVLESSDHQLVRAHTADEALLALLEGEFAAIVLDIQMPDMSGIELANLIKQRKRTQHIPIIFLTAFFQADTDILQGYGVGAVDYLTKPIHPAILKSKVAVFVDLFRKSRALAAANDVLELEILQRRKAAAELKDINSQLEAFVYSIAHDLRTPLRAVEALSKILLDEYGDRLDETGRDFASRINQSAEFMDRLLLDLLEYGRAARAEMELRPVAVKAAWEAARFQCEQQIREREALVEVASPLPLVRANEATLGQVLANLLNNALRFGREGVRPHIRLRAEQGEKAVRLWVEDNGIGIKAEHHERIFRVFEQLHGPNYGGTGIGLAIVRKGIERMDGSVGVESAPGQGSRFWIELPLASAQSPATL